ncbi:inovirus Gp2 family protein [Photobacterium chitinilyticum]|uniref:YagK/YfjJ domain-containing protein n=1 Tax=Photobacterium chitinilyticum TaxID=2485123 RepID=UPI003D11D2DA
MSHIANHESKPHLSYYIYNNIAWLIFNFEQGIDKKILNRIFQTLESMVSYYSKVKVVFLQLHTGEYTDNNAVMSGFIQELRVCISQYYNCKVGFIWVREYKKGEGQHYHLALMVSGHSCLRSKIIQDKANVLWKKHNQNGYSWRVKNRIYSVNRGDTQSIQAAILRLSYFAKKETKNNVAPTTKRFQASRLKPKVPPKAKRLANQQ